MKIVQLFNGHRHADAMEHTILLVFDDVETNASHEFRFIAQPVAEQRPQPTEASRQNKV